MSPKSRLLGVDHLEGTLQRELLRQEERLTTAEQRWRSAGDPTDWDEAHCAVLCIRCIAATHDHLGESEISKRARREIARQAEEWVLQLAKEAPKRG